MDQIRETNRSKGRVWVPMFLMFPFLVVFEHHLFGVPLLRGL